MKMLKMSILVSLIGLFACMESPQVNPDPRVEVSPADDELSGEAELLGTRCCIQYVCPTNSTIKATGCKPGGITYGMAALACKKACGTYCEPGETVCEPM